MRGRKPTSTHLKLVTGNPGRRPLNENEPRLEPALPSVPTHLSDEAKVEWGRLANELHESGLLTRIDRAQLAAYCQAYADWVDAEGQIQRFGKILKTPKRTITRTNRDGSEITEVSGGYPFPSPYLAIRNKALELMHKFGAEFGMSPSSRSRVTVRADGTRDDPAHKYIG